MEEIAGYLRYNDFGHNLGSLCINFITGGFGYVL